MSHEGRQQRTGIRPSHLVALAAVVALAFAPSALAVSVPLANGNDFVLPGGDVYQLGPNGGYHLIPDVATADAMGLRWNHLTRVSGVSPIEAPIPSVTPPPRVKIIAPVTRADGKDYILPGGNVYQRGPNGTYHLVPDVTTANAMGLRWNHLIRASSVGPVGAPIPSVVVILTPPRVCAKTSATKANGNDVILPNGSVYQLGPNGSYHLIPDRHTANAMGVRWNHLIRASHVSPIGAPIASVCS